MIVLAVFFVKADAYVRYLVSYMSGRTSRKNYAYHYAGKMMLPPFYIMSIRVMSAMAILALGSLLVAALLGTR
jgi:hypothetical protein